MVRYAEKQDLVPADERDHTANKFEVAESSTPTAIIFLDENSANHIYTKWTAIKLKDSSLPDNRRRKSFRQSFSLTVIIQKSDTVTISSDTVDSLRLFRYSL